MQILVPGISFCFGGAIIVRLASTDLFTSAVVAHPGPISTAQVEAMKVGTMFRNHLLMFIYTCWHSRFPRHGYVQKVGREPAECI